MKDITGREIVVGDTVAFGLPGTYSMALGEVTQLNKKTVWVKHVSRSQFPNGEFGEFDTLYRRPFADVVVVTV